MATKNYRGCSTLDTARSFIAEFIKMRSRDTANKMYDRFYVITSEEFPRCIKEIKQLNREGALNEQLKNLRAIGSQSYVDTLQNAFQFITLVRNASGIENYGYGRFPYYIDPVVFISLSDCKSIEEIPATVKLDSRFRGDLTKEAYRWDQRLYSVVFRMGAECTPWVPGAKVEPDVANVERIANLVGGNSFRINVHREISPCIEAILQGIQSPGVNVKFLCPTIQNLRLNGETDTPETRLKKRLEQRPLTKINVRIVGGKPVLLHWPIPESYWYKRIESIPPRHTHPIIHFAQDPVVTQMVTDFPFDKYELEPSPLVDYVLERFKGSSDNEKQCLQVFVYNSGKGEGFGKPFGYIKTMSNGTGVNLFIMPYNYPVLMQLIQELKVDSNVKNNAEWKRRMETYLDGVPPYYLGNLRKHLVKFKITGIPQLDEQQRNSYSPAIVSSLTALYDQAKNDREKIQGILNANPPHWLVSQCVNIEKRDIIQSTNHWKITVETLSNGTGQKKDRRDKRDPRSAPGPSTEEEFIKDPEELIEQKDLTQKTKFLVHFAENRIKTHIDSTYRNPLILSKSELVGQIPRMSANLKLFLRDSNVSLLDGGRPGMQLKLHHTEEIHQLPINQMGNYDDYIRAQNEIGAGPLREVEPKAVRSHAFGNPFKTEKKSMAIDEVGEGPAENNSALQRENRNNRRGRPPRRKAGPLAINSLSSWRERRRSISEVSSVVSDISYTSDVDMEDLPEPSTSPTNHVNGFSERNGNGTSSDNEISDALKTWGLEEEMEEPEIEPVVKKTKLEETVSIGSTVDLNETAIREKKKQVVSLVRESNNDASTLHKLNKLCFGLSALDKLELVQLCTRDSRRFKRHGLVKELEKEVAKLQKQLQLRKNGTG